MPTARGIYYDLTQSPYIIKDEDCVFYFSSKKYLEKFKEKSEIYFNEEWKKLEYKYGIDLDCRLFLLISLYTKIEKRGFAIKINNEFIPRNYLMKIK